MFHTSKLDDVYAVTIERLGPGERYPHEAHPFPELIYVRKGRLYARAGRRAVTAGPGDAVYCDAYLVHDSWAGDDESLETVRIGFGLALYGRSLVVHHDIRGRIGQICDWMLENQKTGDPNLKDEQRTLLMAILHDFSRHGGPYARPDRIARVREHVRQHLAGRLTVAILARIAGLSRSRFLHMFKQAVGVTPMADVRAMRMHKARQMLVSTTLPMKDIAAQTGLGDVHAMSRSFRRALGVSPGSFRHTTRRGRRMTGRDGRFVTDSDQR